MKIYILSVLIITILVNWSVVAGDPPLRAMLYCYLPAVNTDNPIPQYANLARIINQKLQTANINVRVQVCDPNGNGGWLYDQTKINSLFNTYDILEVDVSYLWAITDQTQLLTFKKQEIDFYNRVHPFEWEPTTNYIDGQEQIIGSPGLLCSSFLEDRRGEQYEIRLYSKFVSTSAYGLVDLYLNLFINGRPDRTLNDVDYTSTDQLTIRKVAAFLASCQPNPAKFNYDSNWCLKKLSRPFFQTDYSTTTGYSENLFNFLNNGIKEENIMISHITGLAPKKVFFVDSFVAKRSTEQRKKEVLDFYRFMLSDEVLDVYVKGLYTNSPKTTYLLPPTISYLEKLVRQNRLYQSISDTAFQNKVQYPLYQRAFAQNVFSFATLINQALQGLGNEQGEL